MPDGLILGFDCSAAHCAAALLAPDGQLLAARHDAMARGQAEHLMPMLAGLLDGAGAGWGDVGRIGVGTGPGNFTGIRIAVAAARGLALALGCPAIGIAVPQAVALGAGRPCRVVLPGRQGQVIWQDFDASGPIPVAQTPIAQATETALPPGPPPLTQPAFALAEAIARLALAHGDAPAPRPAPIYLRPADAAPARDRGPVMLGAAP
ncbi:tRNA (adenosine(37)-N6)-threonylcarbamoyltransferase complex dimerization subunit type 1 TsaB [Paracoccus jiaweipingae]|uniref:tRNA (adenosine(37)-N6)-threonylcarbamoyltransferase complex dimerization subunit type 1 TsaB n=1 Tax=unclassified Paracoccus (in: a-proteobacteria) TaxID=2688777 RepID=UPI0037BCC638